MTARLIIAAFLTLCLAVLGLQPQSRAQFNGCMAGFCFNAVLPAITDPCGVIPQSGLTHCWSFADADTNYAGNTFNDYVVSGAVNGTLTSVTRNATGHKAGIQSGSFNGTSSHALLASNPFPPISAWSISVWANITSAAATARIIAGLDTSTGLVDYQLLNSATGLCRSSANGGAAAVAATTAQAFVNATWVNCIITVSGATTTIYVNGVSVATSNPGGAGAPSNSNIGSSTASSFYGGLLDTIAVWNRAISSGEAATVAVN